MALEDIDSNDKALVKDKIEDINEILTSIIEPSAIGAWWLTVIPDLGHIKPVEAAALGQLDEVIKVAKNYLTPATYT